VCVLAAKYDFFPIEGTRRTVARCRRFWQMHRKTSSLRLFEDACTHQYSPNHAIAAAAFFSKHLLGRAVQVNAVGMTHFEPASLWCTRSGQVRGEIRGARMIADENRDVVKSLATHRSRKRGLTWLRKTVTKDRKPCDQNLRLYIAEHAEGLRTQFGLWWSQPGIFNHGILFRSPSSDQKSLPVTLAVWNDGTLAVQSHRDWIHETCAKGRAVLVLDTTAVGAISPNPSNLYPTQAFFGAIHTLHNGLDWLGDSIAAMRTWDVLRALDVLENWPDITTTDLRLYTSGRHGTYGRLAAAIDPRIKSIILHNAIRSYADLCTPRHHDTHDLMSIILPGVLQHIDLPLLK